MPKRPRAPLAVSLLVALTPFAPRCAAAAPPYHLLVLPPLPATPFGQYAHGSIRVIAVADDGTLVGWAKGPRSPQTHPAYCRDFGFRYHPQSGYEVIEAGDWRTEIMAVDPQGTVFGVHGLGQGCFERFDHQRRPFRYQASSGFEFLEDGADAQNQRHLTRMRVTSAGLVLGTAVSEEGAFPYLYEPQTGWLDLRALLDAEDAGAGGLGIDLTERGEVAMTIGYEGGLQAGFLVNADGSAEPLGNLGFPFTAAAAIARDRGVYGCSRVSNDPPSDPVDHAFVYRTGTGIADVHPSPQWRMSCAHAETARGVVLGSASLGVRDHAPDLYATGPGWDLRLHLQAVDVQALVPPPLSFLQWDPGAAIKTTNDTLETVGNISVLDATNPLQPFRVFDLPFYHHRLRGTFLLQEFLDAAAPGIGRASRVEAISQRGTIALEIAVPQAPPLDDLILLALLIPES